MRHVAVAQEPLSLRWPKDQLNPVHCLYLSTGFNGRRFLARGVDRDELVAAYGDIQGEWGTVPPGGNTRHFLAVLFYDDFGIDTAERGAFTFR